MRARLNLRSAALAVLAVLVALAATVAAAPSAHAATSANVHLQDVVNPDGVDLTGVTYTLNYSWAAGEGHEAGSASEEITHRRPLTVQAPEGAILTFQLVTSEVDGAIWAETSYSPQQTVPLEGNRPPRVEITPSIHATGAFSIAKTLSGTGSGLVPAGTEFVVTWSHEAFDDLPGRSGQVTVLAGGDAVVVEEIPVGAEISLSEAEPDPITGGHWLDPVFSQQRFTVAADQQATIDLDNPITLSSGAVALTAELQGDGLSMVSDDAMFEVVWSHPAGNGFAAGSGTIEVPASGETVSLTDLPYGAEVTFGAVTPPVVDGAAWSDVAVSEESVTIGDGTTAAVTLSGTITEDDATPPTDEPTGEPTEEPTGEPTEEPTGEPTDEPTGEPTDEPTGEPSGEPELADTGAPNVVAAGAMVLVLMAVGAALLGAGRRDGARER